jgi:hypothetical protein
MKTKLQCGDVIYGRSYKSLTKYVIERVTNTMAISGPIRFKIEISNDGYVRKISAERWANTAYWIETPELKEEYINQRVIFKIKNTDFSKCSMKCLGEILAVLNKYEL